MKGRDDRTTVYAVGIDVTDEEEMLRRMLRSERLAAVGTMAAGLAHEVRNPLNSASLQLTVLERRLDRSDDPANSLPIARIIKSEIDRLDRLVREFLAFARPHPLETKPVDVGELLAGVAGLIAPEAEAAKIAIAVDAAGGTPPVLGDGERLRQVLLNLTRNAIEAMAEHGGRLRLAARAAGAEVEIDVEDDGPGFGEDLPVFDAFFTTKSQRDGPRPGDRSPHRRRPRRHDSRGIAPRPDLLHAGAADGDVSVSARARNASTAVNTPTTCSSLVTMADPIRCRAISPATIASGGVLRSDVDVGHHRVFDRHLPRSGQRLDRRELAVRQHADQLPAMQHRQMAHVTLLHHLLGGDEGLLAPDGVRPGGHVIGDGGHLSSSVSVTGARDDLGALSYSCSLYWILRTLMPRISAAAAGRAAGRPRASSGWRSARSRRSSRRGCGRPPRALAGTSCGGSSATRDRGPSAQSTTARSTTFSSSRTLPGQR